MSEKFKVSLDQDLCVGCGLCPDIEPAMFGMDFGEGGTNLAYVKEVDWSTIYGPDDNMQPEPAVQGVESFVSIPPNLLASVIEAANQTPSECIFIEADNES